VTVSIVGSFIILLIGALYYARGFFLPLVLAMLITLTLTPLVRTLSRSGIPAGVSAVGFVFILAAVTLGAATLLRDPITAMVADAPRVVAEIRDRFAFLREPFAMLNEAAEALEQVGGDSSAAPERVVISQPGLVGWAAGTVAGIGTTLGATLLLTLFLLASSNLLRHKLVHVFPDLSEKKKTLRVLHDIENEVSRYLLTITAINCGLGACTGVAMYLLGMPSPVLWGIAATLLNYIPYIGALTGLAAMTAVSVVTFPTLIGAVLPPFAYLGLQILESNFVTPTVLGRRLELSTVAILIFLAFTTWMWGIVGTIIGVPILVVVKAFSDNFPMLSPLAEFLSGAAPVIEVDSDEPKHPG
jgi:predicted PurR-regulated permease PerM